MDGWMDGSRSASRFHGYDVYFLSTIDIAYNKQHMQNCFFSSPLAPRGGRAARVLFYSKIQLARVLSYWVTPSGNQL